MTDTPPASLPEAAPPPADGEVYLNRMRRAAYGVVLFVLSIHLLEKFRDVLQPFFIALFITFMMQPVHRWLVGRGISSLLAYIVIVCLVMLALFGIGIMIYDNLTSVATKLPEYEDRFDKMLRSGVEWLPPQFPQLKIRPVRDMFSSEELMSWARTALGGFRDFSSWAALTFIYLLFLIAEKVSFPRRIVLAFGAEHGARLKTVGESIHAAIGQYIAVKTLVSALAGLLSYAVMAAFGVEFAATWGVLIFLLNYIPYLGSMIAVALPILLSFLQFDEVWKSIVIAVLLVGIQQIIGAWIEPRMAGQRLDVSPLLILLSLAFWGVVWGIIGMILAVPLLVIVRIILDNIPETRWLATLISNR